MQYNQLVTTKSTIFGHADQVEATPGRSVEFALATAHQAADTALYNIMWQRHWLELAEHAHGFDVLFPVIVALMTLRNGMAAYELYHLRKEQRAQDSGFSASNDEQEKIDALVRQLSYGVPGNVLAAVALGFKFSAGYLGTVALGPLVPYLFLAAMGLGVLHQLHELVLNVKHASQATTLVDKAHYRQAATRNMVTITLLAASILAVVFVMVNPIAALSVIALVAAALTAALLSYALLKKYKPEVAADIKNSVGFFAKNPRRSIGETSRVKTESKNAFLLGPGLVTPSN